jgi:hypothetical protein
MVPQRSKNAVQTEVTTNHEPQIKITAVDEEDDVNLPSLSETPLHAFYKRFIWSTFKGRVSSVSESSESAEDLSEAFWLRSQLL